MRLCDQNETKEISAHALLKLLNGRRFGIREMGNGRHEIRVWGGFDGEIWIEDAAPAQLRMLEAEADWINEPVSLWGD